jgi:hypothetical protein
MMIEVHTSISTSCAGFLDSRDSMFPKSSHTKVHFIFVRCGAKPTTLGAIQYQGPTSMTVLRWLAYTFTMTLQTLVFFFLFLSNHY